MISAELPNWAVLRHCLWEIYNGWMLIIMLPLYVCPKIELNRITNFQVKKTQKMDHLLKH